MLKDQKLFGPLASEDSKTFESHASGLLLTAKMYSATHLLTKKYCLFAVAVFQDTD